MKLRIKGRSIRLRLSKSDIEMLRLNEHLLESSGIGKFSYGLAFDDVALPRIAYRDSQIMVTLPRPDGVTWVDSNQVGIYARCQSEQGTEISLTVEKDWQCMEARTNEDEADLFPNPNSKKVEK